MLIGRPPCAPGNEEASSVDGFLDVLVLGFCDGLGVRHEVAHELLTVGDERPYEEIVVCFLEHSEVRTAESPRHPPKETVFFHNGLYLVHLSIQQQGAASIVQLGFEP